MSSGSSRMLYARTQAAEKVFQKLGYIQSDDETFLNKVL